MSRDLGSTPTLPMPEFLHERAEVCGQHDALVLTERYLERGTFASADFTPTTEPKPVDAFAELT